MPHLRFARPILLLTMVGGLAACTGQATQPGQVVEVPAESAAKTSTMPITPPKDANAYLEAQKAAAESQQSRFFDLFNNSANPNNTVSVNKYIWRASLEVLDFLPVESVDPFTGVIVTGYGTPPGGGRAYRATIYIQDPALDARSLHVSIQTKGGSEVSPETERAVEDAILSRARQLRIADAGL